MNIDIENELRDTLSRDEKFLWTGRPKTGIVFRPIDILIIPFSLGWFGFVIYSEYSLLKKGVALPIVIGLPFVVIGLYISIGRFFLDAFRRKNTVYGITDNRIIIKSGIFNKEIKSLNIRTIAGLTLNEKLDGSGTILLAPTYFPSIFTGIGYWPKDKIPPSIELITDVRKIYNILIDQQRKQ